MVNPCLPLPDGRQEQAGKSQIQNHKTQINHNDQNHKFEKI